MLMELVNSSAYRWACACLKRVSGLRRLKKFLNFLRCIHVFDLVPKFGSDINEGNWLQLLFYFIVLIGIVGTILGMSFFSAAFQVLDWSFLVLHFDGNVCNWIPKVIWPRMDWTEIWKNCSIVIFFDDMKFFRCLVWEVLLFVFLKGWYFLATGFCNIDWWALAMHCSFTFYVCASSLLALIMRK